MQAAVEEDGWGYICEGRGREYGGCVGSEGVS